MCPASATALGGRGRRLGGRDDEPRTDGVLNQGTETLPTTTDLTQLWPRAPTTIVSASTGGSGIQDRLRDRRLSLAAREPAGSPAARA